MRMGQVVRGRRAAPAQKLSVVVEDDEGEEEERRRRKLLRNVHARGAIPNEVGPTRWRHVGERGVALLPRMGCCRDARQWRPVYGRIRTVYGSVRNLRCLAIDGKKTFVWIRVWPLLFAGCAEFRYEQRTHTGHRIKACQNRHLQAVLAEREQPRGEYRLPHRPLIVPPLPKWLPPRELFGTVVLKGGGDIWVRAGGGAGGGFGFDHSVLFSCAVFTMLMC